MRAGSARVICVQNSGNTLLEAAEHRSSIVQNNLPAPEKEIIKPKTVEDDIEPKEPEKSEEIEDGSEYEQDFDHEPNEDSEQDDEESKTESEPKYPPAKDEPPRPPKMYKHDIPPR